MLLETPQPVKPRSSADHIITGDLNIVRDSKLRDILSKTPNTGTQVFYLETEFQINFGFC